MKNRRSKRRKLMGEGREWKGGEGWGVKWDGEGRMSKYFFWLHAMYFLGLGFVIFAFPSVLLQYLTSE